MAVGTTVALARDRVPPHPLVEFWRYFRQNKGAVLGLAIIAALTLVAVFADVLAPHPPAEQYRDALLAPPVWVEGSSTRFILGTDDIGRDMLSRLIHGARVSMLVGISVITLGLVVGVTLGLLAGFFPGILGIAIMRAMDTLLALPALLLAIVIVAILGPGLFNAMLA
ncbi:MAG TPA: dipeptide ABC transporter permease DppC, partial [Alphaproteobacteria bacterium]|nr:dipeptide ABC transporter permease DppC [Alphaproteobacteria bacterium]